MAVSRIAAIPWFHCIAEVAAFPLASETALTGALTSLDPDLEDASTKHLWRDAEKEFVRMMPSVSLDELVAMRDVLWFSPPRGSQSPPRAISLAQYLRNTAKRFLKVKGTLAVPDFTDLEFRDLASAHTAQDRSLWRWVSFALPPDLLLAAAETDVAPPERVDVLTPALEQQLRDGGYTETHLHLGAAIEFPLFWLAVLKSLSALDREQRKLSKAFRSPGAALGEGAQFPDWLLRAVIARYLLGAFLGREGGSGDFAGFLRDVVEERILAEGHGLISLSCIHAALSDLYSGTLGARGAGVPNLAELQTIYASLTAIRTRKLGTTPGQGFEVDPLSAWVPRAWPVRSPEMWLVSQGLKYLESAAGAKDDVFARLFWQVIRLRCLLYRHVTQRPMTPGLQWFIRFFDRLDSGRQFIGPRLQIESALEVCGHQSGLRALEIRVGPKPDMLQFIKESQEALSAPRNASIGLRAVQPSNPERPSETLPPPEAPELSFIVHFSRDRGGGSKDGIPKAFGKGGHSDPEPDRNVTRYRYSHFYNERRRSAVALSNLLMTYPLTLEWIRGVDLCSDEMGVPIWVMAPLLRHVRDASEVASRTLKRMVGLDVSPLRVAVHAGEDFVHLLTGLRLMDEAIDGLRLRPGDRLGHGLALGMDVDRWASRAGRVAMPAEVRLFDLTWEWSWRSRQGGALSRNRHLVIEREVAELSRRIFGEPLPPLTVHELVQNLHDETRLSWARFPNGPRRSDFGEESPFDRLISFLTSPDTFKRGRELIWVEPSSEAEAIEELQRALRRKVGENELVVEVNPSSNLLIGHLEDFAHHPLWRLHPQGAGDGAPPVALTIGSDDPITFATNLRQEFQLLYDTLVLSGRSSHQAEMWIEEVRKAGLAARFTRRWSGQSVTDVSMDHVGELDRRRLMEPP